MNRRTFFRGLLAAACTAVARAYVPAALAKPEAILGVDVATVGADRTCYYIVSVSSDTFRLAISPGVRPVILADGLTRQVP